MTKTPLFKKKRPEDKKSVEIKIRVTEREAEIIRHAADIRNIHVSEYIVSTALGRKADVDYGTEAVLALRNVVAEMRVTCGVIVEYGITPAQLEAVLQPIVDNAVAAMKRI